MDEGSWPTTRFSTLLLADHVAVCRVRDGCGNQSAQRELPFVIEYGNGDEKVFAGTISFHSLSVKNSVGELGYWMTSSMRGKGIATTAARMLTDYGFATIGFKRIEAIVDRDNVASLKLLESAGYQREGLLRKKISRDDLAALRLEVRRCEDRLTKLNDMRDKLAKKLADPALYESDRIGELETWNRKYAEVMEALDRAEALWMAAEEKLDAAS